MANLRQIPSILRANDSAVSARKKIEPSIKRTMWDWTSAVNPATFGRNAWRHDGAVKGPIAASGERQGILILNEIGAGQR